MDNIYLKHVIKKIKLKECEYNTIKSMIGYYDYTLYEVINDICIESSVTFAEVFKHEHAHTHTSTSDDQNKIIPDYDIFINALYKDLAVKTHPDKTENNDDFVIIKEAYEKKDILKLIDYANKYDLSNSQSINSNLLTLVLEKQLYETKNKVKQIKSTLGYQLLMQSKNDAVKYIRELIETYKKCQELTVKIEKSTT